jgi:hypothetical protein
VKASELLSILNSLPEGTDPELVTGEEWLPERLLNLKPNNNYLFCQFDNAPEENQGDEEARGFVEHEIKLIREKVMDIFMQKASLQVKQDAILALILFAHEQSSTDVVEMLETFELSQEHNTDS